MTDARMTGLAAQALNMAKRDMEQRSDFNFLIASYHEGDGLHRMSKVEAMLIERLGESWLNSGAAKDFGFGIIKLYTVMHPPDAIVLVTPVNMFKTTKAFDKLPVTDQAQIIEAGHDRHHEAVREGLMTISDALMANVQTVERVCVYTLERAADARPEVRMFNQSEFRGRAKFYGGNSLDIMKELLDLGDRLTRRD
jgi:hypothetical protein